MPRRILRTIWLLIVSGFMAAMLVDLFPNVFHPPLAY